MSFRRSSQCVPRGGVDVGACRECLADLFRLYRHELLERAVLELRVHPDEGTRIEVVEE